MNYKKHIINENISIEEAMKLLDEIGEDTILFTINNDEMLSGSLSDGDLRRGLLKGYNLNQKVRDIYNSDPKFIFKTSLEIEHIIELRKNNFLLIPLVDDNKKIINIINLNLLSSFLPIDVVIMAGGLGKRLRPLTNSTPKPLLKVGNKTIIEYSIDRLKKFGVNNFWISVNYLAEKIEDFLGNGLQKQINIKYIHEDKPMGTIGSVSKISYFENDYVLITNSDILTNLDYENFFLDFIKSDADMSVATIAYDVNIPYAVVKTVKNKIESFEEKPTYTYYSNAGIYLVKKSILKLIPQNMFFNSTDLMELLIKQKYKIVSYPTRKYWLDIGRMSDFNKANEDIKNIKF